MSDADTTSDAANKTVDPTPEPRKERTYEDIAFLAELNRAFFGQLSDDNRIMAAVTPMLRRIGFTVPAANRLESRSIDNDYGFGRGAVVQIAIYPTQHIRLNKRAELARRLSSLWYEADGLREYETAMALANAMTKLSQSENSSEYVRQSNPIVLQVDVAILQRRTGNGARFVCDSASVDAERDNPLESFRKASEILAESIFAKAAKVM